MKGKIERLRSVVYPKGSLFRVWGGAAELRVRRQMDTQESSSVAINYCLCKLNRDFSVHFLNYF